MITEGHDSDDPGTRRSDQGHGSDDPSTRKSTQGNHGRSEEFLLLG